MNRLSRTMTLNANENATHDLTANEETNIPKDNIVNEENTINYLQRKKKKKK